MEVTSPRRRWEVQRRPKTGPADRSGTPSWAQLPEQRRRRLVAVLGDLVLRIRAGADEQDEAGGQREVIDEHRPDTQQQD